ncbi:MAG: TVP38/TMEM64 family protein [Eubacterium sp.]
MKQKKMKSESAVPEKNNSADSPPDEKIFKADHKEKKKAVNGNGQEDAEKGTSDPEVPDGKLTGRRKAAAILKMLILFGILIGIPAYILFCQRHIITDMKSFSTIVHYLRVYKGKSYLIYIIAQILQILVSFLPGEVFQFAAGYLFGVIPGLLLSVGGAALGTGITYYVAKFLGEDALSLFIKPDKLRKYRKMMNSEKAYIATFFMYLIPGTPKDICCYIAGVSDMKARPFILLSLIGRTPGMLGSLIFGAMYYDRNYKVMAVLGVIVLVIILICFIKRKALNRFIDQLYQKII